ncbi:protein kinase [Streptomyces sp. NPDC058417]|uniref:serine/threonine-protein kinase n=1 Tax=unclassified Streptomyces TaxID=2593676 RepID=UPI0036657BB6
MEKLGPGDPQRIGGYRLLGRLGAGGMGQVYLARSDRGRTVAVKLVRPELAAREEFRARFRQEVRNAQRVGGFWTAPVLDADTEAAVPWVATGYVAGPSLQRVVGEDHGPLPERSVRILAAGLAHALTNIHAAGIVHRDLKPSNVMVTIEGPRVIDFGVARALETLSGDAGLTRLGDRTVDQNLTQTGAVVGSPGFMAPEQVRGERITPACDVFCLGSVLYYAATGALPFGSAETQGVHALLFRIAEEEPDLTGLPEGVAHLVRACLRKDPAARPALDWILERTGAEDTVAEGRSRDPWLPGTLVAQLGRHAVRLLETENPEGPGDPGGADAAPQHSGPRGADGRHPTLVAGAPTQAPPHPAYGHPQQHPQPAPGPYRPHNPYSAGPPYPQATPYDPYGAQPTAPVPRVPGQDSGGHDRGGYDQGGFGPAPAGYGPGGYNSDGYGPGGYGPEGYGLDEPDEEPRRSRRATALLVAVGVVVALAAGGSVYALMNGDDSSTAGPEPTRSASAPDPSGSTSEAPSPSSSPSPSPSTGTIPAGYLGTWTTTIDNEAGTDTRRLTLAQGEVGDTVLKLIADGDSYHCEFTAELTRRPGDDGPLELGPSTVTTGEPRTSCTPGDPTEVTLLPDGRLQRLNPSTGEKLTYTKR